MTFKALRVHNDDGIEARYDQIGLSDLSDGDVVIKTAYSSINYKDALAVTGKGRIMKSFPLVGGIDVSGVVETSANSRCKPGDQVVVTGCGLGEDRDGGYAEYVRVPGESVVALPEGLSLRDAMALGTAGFTAALAISRMEHNGLEPGAGSVVVTGATGGVGSLAVDMLAGRGYEVAAVTGKASSVEYLKTLGASEILLRENIDYGSRPLEKARWAGAVDNVGGEMLTWLTRTTDWWGSIASIGLAGSHELNTTVMPFILRGVSLLGINSVATPRDLRLKVWQRLASDLRPTHLDTIGKRELGFDELIGAFGDFMAGKVTGRTVVRIGNA